MTTASISAGVVSWRERSTSGGDSCPQRPGHSAAALGKQWPTSPPAAHREKPAPRIARPPAATLLALIATAASCASTGSRGAPAAAAVGPAPPKATAASGGTASPAAPSAVAATTAVLGPISAPAPGTPQSNQRQAPPPQVPAAAATASGGPPLLPPPRPVDAIVSDLVTALGGAAATTRHRSMHVKMEITFNGLGITGTVERFAAEGDRALTITTIPNLMTAREGCDGKICWAEDSINALRTLSDEEAEHARIESAWNAETRLKNLYAKIEAKNERGPDGRVYECLVLTPERAPALTSCLDPATHLVAYQRGVRAAPQGMTPFSMRLADWRTVEDIKVPFLTEMQAGPVTFTGRVISVELDKPIDPATFAKPSTRRPKQSTAPARP